MTQYINLYNPDLRRSRDYLDFHWVAGVLAAVLCLLVLGTVYSTLRASFLAKQVAERQGQLKAVKEDLERTMEAMKHGPDAGLQAEAAQLKQDLDVRREALQMLRSGKLGGDAGFSSFLQGFSRLTMEGLWLTGFDIDGSSGEMEIRGRMVNQALLPEYLRRLNREASFQGRSFAALNMAGVEPGADLAPQAAPGGVPPKPAAAMGQPQRYVEFALRSREAVKEEKK